VVGDDVGDPSIGVSRAIRMIREVGVVLRDVGD
jgi:hypothetical protein